LTSGTLYGIYSPSTTGPFGNDEDDQDQYFPDTTDTPIETPAPRPGGLDEETYRLMRSRASRESFSSSSFQSGNANLLLSSSTGASFSSRGWVALLHLLLRAALLFVLGVGYGVLVTRLPQSQGCHPGHQHRHLAAYYESQYEWRYLVFWGVAGVALGSLLPWFDRFWETSAAQMSRGGGGVVFPSPSSKETTLLGGRVDGSGDAPITEKASASVAPQADWALVVRGIGAFVGIVFAIRKLPWASTMQVSLTLALVNPFLWYLIDRSKPGFLLSAAVGLAGSAVMMGLDPHAMPAPTTAAAASASSSSAASLLSRADDPAGFVGGHGQGLASQETIEMSIWMLSVLFCSCVCFGNIGRRLALNSSAAGRGRWGGVR
jgi:hypothetical protein